MQLSTAAYCVRSRAHRYLIELLDMARYLRTKKVSRNKHDRMTQKGHLEALPICDPLCLCFSASCLFDFLIDIPHYASLRIPREFD